jgi:hypothetical protein
MRDAMPTLSDFDPTPETATERPWQTLVAVGIVVLVAVAIAAMAFGLWPFGAPTQSSAPTAGSPSIGQRAYIEQDAEGEPSQQEYVYRLRVTLKMHPGVWEDGTRLGVRLKLKEPCLRWTIDPEHQAFGNGTEVLKQGPGENTDLIEYSAVPKMRPGANVVIDIEGATPPEVVEGAWRPMAKDVQ